MGLSTGVPEKGTSQFPSHLNGQSLEMSIPSSLPRENSTENFPVKYLAKLGLSTVVLDIFA